MRTSFVKGPLRDVARSGRVDGIRRVSSLLLLQPARPPPESVGRASERSAWRRGSLSLLCLSFRDCLRKGRKRGGMFSRSAQLLSPPRRVRLRWNFDRTLLRTMAQLIVPDAATCQRRRLSRFRSAKKCCRLIRNNPFRYHNLERTAQD